MDVDACERSSVFGALENDVVEAEDLIVSRDGGLVLTLRGKAELNSALSAPPIQTAAYAGLGVRDREGAAGEPAAPPRRDDRAVVSAGR